MKMDITQYVNAQFLILIPVIYLIGMFIKSANFYNNRFIPLTLGVTGIVLGILLALLNQVYSDIQLNVFNGAMQGLFCAGMAVFGNEVYSQMKNYINEKKEDQNANN